MWLIHCGSPDEVQGQVLRRRRRFDGSMLFGVQILEREVFLKVFVELKEKTFCSSKLAASLQQSHFRRS